MAYTNFTGEIYLLKGTPFNPNYDYSIAFSSLNAQETYMRSKVDVTLTAQNYIKTEAGKIRVDVQEEHIRDCNYMMWKTPVIGDEPPGQNVTWMYAFIIGIDYISNNVSEITYQIDVLQTYALFNVTFKDCMIERTHVNDDDIGKHIEPEPVSFSETKIEFLSNLYEDSSGYRWLVYAPFDFPIDTSQILTDGIDHRLSYTASMGNVCGIYQGLVCTVFDTDTLLNTFTANIPDDIASMIVAIVGVPKGFVESETGNYPGRLAQHMSQDPHQSNYIQDANIQPTYDYIDGYSPRNNKLFTYPYNSLLLSDGEGNGNTYRWEYFNLRSGLCQFKCILACQPEPELMVVPKGYGTHSGQAQVAEETLNFEEKIVLSNFPKAAWIGNTFASWCANQGLTNGVNALLGCLGLAGTFGTAPAQPDYSDLISWAVGGGGNALPGGSAPAIGGKGMRLAGHPGMAALGAIGMGAKMGVATAQAVRKPNQSHGTSGGGAMLAGGYKAPRFYKQYINYRDAQRIDDFFTRYGYAINRIGTPSFTNTLRNQHYVKTADCLVIGNCASEYCRLIEGIFNHGVTWWKSPSVIGDYN